MSYKMRCPDCNEEREVMATDYGQRAICSLCSVRWTRVLNHKTQRFEAWVAERWTGLVGNR